MWAADAVLNKDIPDTDLKKGNTVVITKGLKYKYALWCHEGIYDLPACYIKRNTITGFTRCNH